MIRKLEDLLVVLFLAASEVLAEFLDTICDIVESPPSPVVIQLDLVEVLALIDMLPLELTDMHWIPVC